MLNLRPSSSYIWTNCAANPLFSSKVPEQPPSDPAREGTCAAWVAERVLKGEVLHAIHMVGEVHENGWIVTHEMTHHVQGYITRVQSHGGQVSAERTVMICEYIKGTYDASVVAFMGDTLYVDDLKYGFDIVEVFQNTQTIIYGAGEYIRLGKPAHIKKVQLGIYQPRGFHAEGIYRTWTMTVEELMGRAQWIVDQGARCQQEFPLATPGEWCLYCKGATICAALAKTIYRMSTMVMESQHNRELTHDELASEMAVLHLLDTLIKARWNALEPVAEHAAKTKGLRGFHMKPRVGKRKFKEGVTPFVIKAMTGVDAVVEKPVTPAELERRNVSSAMVEILSYQPNLPKKLDRLTETEIANMFRKDK